MTKGWVKRLWQSLSPTSQAWASAAAIIGLIGALGGLPAGAAVIAPYMPVLWNQFETAIDQRAQARDAQISTIAEDINDQLNLIHIDALQNQISTLCGREDILFSRQQMIAQQLKAQPDDVVAGSSKQITDQQIEDEKLQRRAAEQVLATLEHSTFFDSSC